MNKTELKAKAYDLLAQMEAHQFEIEKLRKELVAVNEEIKAQVEE